MAYYVRHYFNPDFNYENLRPESLKDGNVNHHYLGYVQNVIAGQVLAEVIDLEKEPCREELDQRFIFNKKILPCGPNCTPHPQFPDRILAKSNGYVFYHQGLITVKRLLNVRRDVDFHTGNILFVGDIVAHEAVRTGFVLLGGNVLVKGTVEGAAIIAEQDIVCESGIKGVGHGLLKCGGNAKITFCEGARIHALGNVEIEGHCLHSEIYAGGSLLIKGRLHGGKVCSQNIVYVGEQAGGGQNTSTKMIMGYNPQQLYSLHRLQDEILRLRGRLASLEGLSRIKPMSLEDMLLKLVREKLHIKQSMLNNLSENIKVDEKNTGQCRIICAGGVKSGLEISIAQAYMAIQDSYDYSLEFHLENNEIVNKPSTA